EDVQGFADRGPAAPSAAGPGLGLTLAPWPSVDFEKFGPVERVPRSRIQKISAPNLARNWAMIPHVTHNDEADITELEPWRRRLMRSAAARSRSRRAEGSAAPRSRRSSTRPRWRSWARPARQ